MVFNACSIKPLVANAGQHPLACSSFLSLACSCRGADSYSSSLIALRDPAGVWFGVLLWRPSQAVSPGAIPVAGLRLSLIALGSSRGAVCRMRRRAAGRVEAGGALAKAQTRSFFVASAHSRIELCAGCADALLGGSRRVAPWQSAQTASRFCSFSALPNRIEWCAGCADALLGRSRRVAP